MKPLQAPIILHPCYPCPHVYLKIKCEELDLFVSVIFLLHHLLLVSYGSLHVI